MSILPQFSYFFCIAGFLGASPYWPSGHQLKKFRLFQIIIFVLISFHSYECFRYVSSNIVNDCDASQHKLLGYCIYADLLKFLSHICSLCCCIPVILHGDALLLGANDLFKELMAAEEPDEERHERKSLNFEIICTLAFSAVLTLCVAIVTFENWQDRPLFAQISLLYPMTSMATSLHFSVLIFMIHVTYGRVFHELTRPRITKKIISKVVQLDSLAKDFAAIVNSAFGPYNYSHLLQSGMFCTAAEFYAAERGLFSHEAIHYYLICFPFLAHYVHYLGRCISVKKRTRLAEETARYLHQNCTENSDPFIREEVEIFSLLLRHRKIEFTACGFFQLDFSLLYTVVGTVTTYIVVLMQFQALQSKNCTVEIFNTSSSWAGINQPT